MLVFGPVPSRRLGRSLGVNNIPPKTCTYGCVYCQVGRTTQMGVERREFYDPDRVVAQVKQKVEQARTSGTPVDYITFVPDGEPTLDVHLGREIDQVKALGPKIGVISNASLIGREDVGADLAHADWVSLKVDAVQEDVWHKTDRPHGKLVLSEILEGTRQFADGFSGELVTETMLARGVNDGPESLAAIAAHLAQVRPARAYISVPTRPPAEPWVQPPTAEALQRAYRVFSMVLESVEYLIDYEGSTFTSLGDVARDILAITAVHPMREDAVQELLNETGTGKEAVEKLLEQRLLTRGVYDGQTFYMRRFQRKGHPGIGSEENGG